MDCPRCQAENRQGRRFCASCGVPLPVACPDCGFGNEENEAFCGGCGAPLVRGQPERRDQPPKAGPAGDRRQVTVVFADLCGFTVLAGRLDAEELHALVGRFLATVDGIVEDHGGAVDKHIGDAVMALFGAPVAHGDDPWRAVRAAFQIHEAMAALGAELRRPLQAHIGVASGEVVAAGLGGDYTVVGESVNLAARLDAMAGPGETLVSDPVRHAVLGRAECEPLGEVAVKGVDRPVRVWRLLGLSSGATEAAGRPFVGRRSELGQFTGVIEACRGAGFGQTVLVRGEAGIGKTGLVQEFTRLAAARGFSCHRALVLDFGVGKGQDAVRALVRSLLGVAPGGGEEARQAAADRAVADAVLEADRRVFLNDLLDLPQPVEMRAMYDAMDNATRNRGKQETVVRLVAAASVRQPVLLVVEDIHWADSLTLVHLAGLAATVKDRPAVLVMTSRIEGDPLDRAWRAQTGGTPLIAIDLGPLRREEAVTLAAAYIDAADHKAIQCIERAAGNPLFLEQLLRNAGESAEDSLPASIQSLVLARTDRLPEGDKRALQAASAIGQRFPLDVLRHLAGDQAYRCDELVKHFLVRPEGEGYLF
ncbi:MAG: adenylate/guanylate cyclase domain-containing protein, partial [Dongiaceae bacterium]